MSDLHPMLNPVTLCFKDARTEREFRAYHARLGRRQLRRFLAFIVALSVPTTMFVQHHLLNAHARGVALREDWLNLPSSAGIWLGALLVGLLFTATFFERLVMQLQKLTFICFAALLVIDQGHSSGIPLSWAVSGTLVNLAVIYTALQLRFFLATLLGVGFTVLHVTVMLYLHQPWAAPAEVQLQVVMNLTLLVAFNLMFMFITHQRELHARTAFASERTVAQRSQQLEHALHNLKGAEAQLVESEKQAAVGRLLAGVLHEFNTPLGALNSATDTLQRLLERARRLAPAASSRKQLDNALKLVDLQRQTGHRLASVVDDFRHFVGDDSSPHRHYDLRAALSTALSLAGPALKDVEVSAQMPSTPVFVYGPAERLNRALLDLLQNAAASFTEDSDRPRRLNVKLQVEAGLAEVVLEDTGRGIEQERLASLFELDFSRQGSRVKLHMGLPTSRKAIEAAGGTIHLDSRLGRGTRVRIRLPLAQPPKAVDEASPTTPRSAEASPASKAPPPPSPGA